MVSEMESVNKNATNNSAYVANSNSQPVHSPQSVGIEFVRQYYTMLNRAPHLLFRFYSEDSTFVHGFLDKKIEDIQYVRGQKQINAKIMSLNFKNCHTKIRQVDSMETIGNGVVIQVIGELSNNSQPMRRFLQTFVLTPQSPNKYYVRNDIFRYQDEVYVEENDEHNEKSDIDSKLESTSEAESLPPTEINKEFNYPSNGNAVVEVNSEENIDSVEELAKENTEVTNEIFEETETPYQPEDEQANNEDEADSVSDFGSSTNPLSDEPKTYANMVSKCFPATVSANNTNQIPNKSNPINLNLNTEVVSVPIDVVSPVLAPPAVVANKREFSVQRENRFVKKAGFQKRNETKEVPKYYDSDSGDGENQINSGTKKQYPDENQLFIGNLLPNFCEEDLQNNFQQYGKILDVRINRQTHKLGSNKANRNYGFITFESPEVVDQIIAQKPIYFSNHRYNVEKKQGKSVFRESDRNRSNLNPNSRNASQSSTGTGSTAPRHSQANSAGQGNLGTRTRPGQNYNNVNNRNFNNGSNFVNRNQAFNNNSNQNR